MKRIKLTMINEDITGCPLVPLRDGFSFRPWQPDDKQTWAEIETAAKEFPSLEAALRRFTDEFTGFEAELQSRCLILQTEDGKPIGTAMGWYNEEFRDGSYGRLHWVSITPEYQGLGLARPLITRAIDVMKRQHIKAYLNTYTVNHKAIRLYLDYGFRPLLQTEDCLEGWGIVGQVLGQEIPIPKP